MRVGCYCNMPLFRRALDSLAGIEPFNQFWRDLHSAAMIADQRAAQSLHVLCLERCKNVVGFLLDCIKRQRSEALYRLEALGQRLECEGVFRVSGPSDEREEDRVLTLPRLVRRNGARLEAERGAAVQNRQKQKVAMPCVEMAERSLRKDRHSKTFVAGSVDEALAGQPVERVADRRDARVMLVGKKRRLQPVARAVASAPELLLDGRIDAFEGAGPGHHIAWASARAAAGQCCCRTKSASNSSWSGRNASHARIRSGT